MQFAMHLFYFDKFIYSEHWIFTFFMKYHFSIIHAQSGSNLVRRE